MGNVARSKTTRGEGLVPRSRQTGNQLQSRATVEKTREPVPRFSYLGVPAQAGMVDRNGRKSRVR